jgi:hypothetical protein
MSSPQQKHSKAELTTERTENTEREYSWDSNPASLEHSTLHLFQVPFYPSVFSVTSVVNF